jgi:apolipoprotein N-acyltransferase
MTTRADYALAAGSGALLAFSFPPSGDPAIAWVALVPLLVALSRGSLVRAFFLGLLTGTVYFVGTLYWISRVMSMYGGLQQGTAILINALLVAYQAFFPAVFAVACRRLLSVVGPAAWLATPALWAAMELGRTVVLTGFPWMLLGYSQTSVTPIAQLASVLGVYGISGLIAAVNASLVYAVVPIAGFTRPRGVGRYVPLALACSATVAVGIWGSRRVAAADLTRAGEPVTVGMVQGNVDQSEKWNPSRASAIFGDYLQLTRDAIGGGARFVLWPESSTPFYFEEDRPAADQVRVIARDAQVSILVGSDQIERSASARYFNAAFMVTPAGETGGVYRKMHLVPFGEFVPFKGLLFFAAPLVEAVSDFSAGEETVLLPVGRHLTSTAICYEVVYPDLVRQGVAQGSELLTTITNDAWFGRTAAPYQHFAQAAMRAIENGRYLVRAANTGISGIVDPYGRVLAQSAIYERAVIVGQARFLTDRTIYTRTGDVFAYASAVATLGLLVGARRRVE